MPTTVDQDLPSKDISIIIPTYNRETKTLQRTVDSILSLAEVKAGKFSIEILIIDQNYPSLDLSIFDDQNHHIFYAKSYAIEDTKINEPYDDSKKIEILHFFGLNPSVTKAKNFALSRCRGEYIVFFDDDIKVHQNCLENYIYILKNNSDITFLGGREIIKNQKGKRPYWKSFVLDFLFKASSQKNNEYIGNNKYIGRITPTSIMYWNFDEDCDYLVKIDSVRGCNWVLRRTALDSGIRFDTNFQGNALREETDFCLRLREQGHLGYYTARSTVTHYRQLGGCENLKKSMNAFISTLDNEVYFQRKHFQDISSFYFFLRLIPLIFDFFKISLGASFILAIQATLNLKKNITEPIFNPK